MEKAGAGSFSAQSGPDEKRLGGGRSIKEGRANSFVSGSGGGNTNDIGEGGLFEVGVARFQDVRQVSFE